MIEESTDDDQIAISTRCAFSWIISQGFCEHCFAVHFLPFQSYPVSYLIVVWAILLETEKMCFVKMLNSVILMLWFLTFMGTESEFLINAAESAEADGTRSRLT
jgi:hypothetical protein